MKREIKFRGKGTNNGYWYCGYYLVKFKMHILQNEDDIVQVIGDTVGQYTGINDKDNIDVYEHDIITFGKSKTTYKVCFINDGWIGISSDGDKYGSYTKRLYPSSTYSQLNDYITVIGNTHDNL